MKMIKTGAPAGKAPVHPRAVHRRGSRADCDQHAGGGVETSVAKSIVRFESRMVIQGPVSEVFDRLADLPGYGGWMHRTGLFRGCSLTSQAPVRRGTTLGRGLALWSRRGGVRNGVGGKLPDDRLGVLRKRFPSQSAWVRPAADG